MKKFLIVKSDERKTRLTNFDFAGEEEDAEPIEKKELLIHYTNLGNIYTQTSSSLVTHKRGGAGAKLKLKDNETIIQTLSDDNFSSLLVSEPFLGANNIPSPAPIDAPKRNFPKPFFLLI